jgi:hypothetical protein
MFFYLTIIAAKSGIIRRRSYSATRPDFLPTAYVVLTRETGFGPGKFRD